MLFENIKIIGVIGLKGKFIVVYLIYKYFEYIGKKLVLYLSIEIDLKVFNKVSK